MGGGGGRYHRRRIAARLAGRDAHRRPGLLRCRVSGAGASRRIPLGQTESQRILASLEADVAATAGHALTASLDDLGSATFRADLASLRHETQYTRLFRS